MDDTHTQTQSKRQKKTHYLQLERQKTFQLKLCVCTRHKANCQSKRVLGRIVPCKN